MAFLCMAHIRSLLAAAKAAGAGIVLLKFPMKETANDT